MFLIILTYHSNDQTVSARRDDRAKVRLFDLIFRLGAARLFLFSALGALALLLHLYMCFEILTVSLFDCDI